MSDLPIHLYNVALFVPTTSVGIGAIRSAIIPVEQSISYCVQFVWSAGTGIIGNIYLEASNDGVFYTQIQQSLLALTNGAGSHMINVEKPAYSSFRLVVELSAGSLTIDSSRANGKRE